MGLHCGSAVTKEWLYDEGDKWLYCDCVRTRFNLALEEIQGLGMQIWMMSLYQHRPHVGAMTQYKLTILETFLETLAIMEENNTALHKCTHMQHLPCKAHEKTMGDRHVHRGFFLMEIMKNTDTQGENRSSEH